MIKSLKFRFIYFFQEILVFHVRSLHFRAKTIASMIACNNDYGEEEIKILKDISKKIYPEDTNRSNMLEEVTIYYVEKIISKKDKLSLDKLIIDINRQINKTPRFRKKILTDFLVLFTTCTKDSKSSIIQFRVLEFFENLTKEENIKK